jgi:hypothetical protein
MQDSKLLHDSPSLLYEKVDQQATDDDHVDDLEERFEGVA